ncbi:inositol polyphosphate 5-phosphatase K [Harpegnathos saltator]|uniref:Skeletal muscle and kidney-enriched inositol phosphatase n=1 Tax=Harpegnathos saltator TaxID=610380 RepID=E2BJT2_HARSA|nr:inositol polyphosphate 5-phosphatase K [Harpegnathos saltator]XP_019697219.1 inositol polyphosphate 5-phosphatase K [Harpegnathos saltator]EFN84057.1 Skeletal muscle and kidney-enriched inositol phosphatase [Harpegnathos saltator]
MASPVKQLRFYFVTWNVATKFPSLQQDLHQLLGITPYAEPEQWPDLYFIGLQEVKSQPQNMVLDYILFEDPWTKAFRDVLKRYDYVKIRSQRLQGLVLNAFCLRKHMTHLRSVEAQYTRTGFGGMWGNKGAVSIRMTAYGVSICIVNTHLTPHDHLLADRISDYNTIVTDHTFTVSCTTKILYHDYIFWIGDLNFRLNGEDLTAVDIDSMVKKKQLEKLLERDQLRMVMRDGQAFAELNENAITFPPTYKYEFESQAFDLKRRPSWTDRILYKVNAVDIYDDIQLHTMQHTYKSHSSYSVSDHKPVTGEFDIVVRPIVTDDIVEFQDCTMADHFISYKLQRDFTPGNADWIGLFSYEFSSLDDYIVYEYISRGKLTSPPGDSLASTERIFFSDTALRLTETYCLVYVAQRGDIMEILGVSPAFSGPRRPIEAADSST